MAYHITSGRSYPLGATHDGNGINFALFSANAEKVELCLFDESGTNEIKRITLPEFTDDVWHCYIADLPLGTLYGYRVYGPFEPHQGHRFNPNKLLLDPYAKKLQGDFISSDQNFAYDRESSQQDLTVDSRDNAEFMPKCVVIGELDKCHSHPEVRDRDSIIYELHVKGFTKQHPDVPVSLQGTFAGLANENVCKYLQDLGVTSIELLPVQTFVSEEFAEKRGLSNYWGYNSIAFFVPHAKYCHSGEIAEFRAMVETFHHAGIEVILDVVYNHTAEGNELGPTYSFRGIDNASYYRLQNDDKRFYTNFAGCGNTINMDHPRVVQLITDSLRYWVNVMGVDGFRFDLAPILGRVDPHYCPNNAFFTALRQDPTLAKVKLIAEPWDIGEGGYQLGNFPKSWLEWNDKFRDTTRRFWRGDDGLTPDFAARLHGSSDIFEKPGRRPSASVNLITSHDGFTLQDLVSFEERHNNANGEENRDGHHGNFSCNFGVEGQTTNETINRLRARQKRNLLTTLFIAQGTPMLLAGDEFGNSQQGNNNAYCQDNELSWLAWQENDLVKQEINFVSELIAFRKAHPLLNRTQYHHGNQISNKTGLADISWLNSQGQTMQENNWHDSEIKCFSMLLAETEHLTNNTNEDTVNANELHNDDALLIIFNANKTDINYQLPILTGVWQKLIDTAEYASVADKTAMSEKEIYITEPTFTVTAHSCVVLSFVQKSADTA